MKQSRFLFKVFFILLLFSCGPGKDRMVILHTSMGDIRLRLFRDTPQHRDNFIRFAGNATGDSILFYRILRDQLIQFGPVKSRGEKGLEPEIKVPLRSGALAAVLSNEHGTQSEGSKFFIVQGRPQTDSTLNLIEQKQGLKFSGAERRVYLKYGGLPQFHGKYTVFGQVMEGMEVVNRIAALPRDVMDRPLEEVWVQVILE